MVDALVVPDALAALYEANPEMRKAMGELHETWAAAPTDFEGEREFVNRIVHTYLRAAYGSGYCTALSNPTSCPVGFR